MNLQQGIIGAVYLNCWQQTERLGVISSRRMSNHAQVPQEFWNCMDTKLEEALKSYEVSFTLLSNDVEAATQSFACSTMQQPRPPRLPLSQTSQRATGRA